MKHHDGNRYGGQCCGHCCRWSSGSFGGTRHQSSVPGDRYPWTESLCNGPGTQDGSCWAAYPFVISGLVLGILVGEALNIEGKLEQVGLYLGKRFSQKGETGAFAKGFLTTSLIYCVGAMAIVGSIQDGLNGDASTLYTKAMIDGLSAIMYGANMGAGVMASALSVFFIKGH